MLVMVVFFIAFRWIHLSTPLFFFSSRRRHTIFKCDWSSHVCSSDLDAPDCSMKIQQQSGASETHQRETGKAYWLTADPPNTLHADVNAGTKPIEVMIVELQRPSSQA